MSKCYECRSDVPVGIFRCDSCLKLITEGYRHTPKDVRHTGLTEWEEMKLSFYKSDKKWEENIRNRQIINGNVFYRTNRGELRPMPSSRKQMNGSYR